MTTNTSLAGLIGAVAQGDRFRLARYFAAGVAVSLGYTLTIVALVDWLHLLNPELANVLSLLLWTIISYVVHREFTFRFSGGYGESAIRFIFLFVLKLIASVAVIAMATRYFQSWYLIGVVVNWIILPVISYIGMKVWVFKFINPKMGAVQRNSG